MRTLDPRRAPHGWRAATLVLFTLRHLVGIALFVWVTVTALRTLPGWIGILTAALTAAYILVAVLSWVRLFRLFRQE